MQKDSQLFRSSYCEVSCSRPPRHAEEPGIELATFRLPTQLALPAPATCSPQNTSIRHSAAAVMVRLVPMTTGPPPRSLPDAIQNRPILEDAQQLVVRGDVVEVGALLVGEEQVGLPDGVQHGGVQVQGVVGVLLVGQPRVVPLLS